MATKKTTTKKKPAEKKVVEVKVVETPVVEVKVTPVVEEKKAEYFCLMCNSTFTNKEDFKNHACG